FEPRSRRQADLGGDLGLRLLDGAAEIAVAHAELDWQITLLLLAVDVGWTGQQPHRRDFAQRDLRDAVDALYADAKVADVVRALTELRRKPHHDRKMAVAAGLVEIARGIAADRDSNGRVDVAGRQSVARRLGAVDVDLHGRLAERGKHRKIGDARDRGQHGFDL